MSPARLNKVLCINDNDITLFILKHTIRQADFAAEVLSFKDGEAAESYLAGLLSNKPAGEQLPDLIFLDLHMPVMDGWEFLQIFSSRFKAHMPDTRIIINSYSVDSGDMQKVKEYPFVIDFLEKGVDIEYLSELRGRLAQAV